MSKREHERINGTGESAGLRHSKRRREGEASSDVDVTTSDPIEMSKMNGGEVSAQQVKEQGMILWNAVKDAVNKEGYSLSEPFLRKPPKRIYPDYYELIQQPIALDDIKKKLDHLDYPSLQAVKSDFELLVANAKQYNQAESLIVQDAKELMKLVQKAYNKIVPSDEEHEEKKAPSLNRLMKTRLEKLVSKKDPTGRVLSEVFMVLPSKKDWAIYYKEIKHPQCLEAIYKHIKRKEYHSAAQFAADVELVFSNAMTFNQDHSPIWNDAMTLRDYFRQLMSDMPPPHTLAEYSKYVNKPNKIKIKPPQALQASAAGSTQQLTKQDQGATSSLLLRVPAAHPPSSSKITPQASTPAHQVRLPLVTTTLPAPAETVAPTSKTTKVQTKPQIQPPAKAPATQAPTPQAPVQTVSFINATASHYPRAPYVPQASAQTPAPAVASATPPVFHAPPANNSYSTSQSPAPIVLPLNRQLKSIDIRIQPTGRALSLDHRDGVKSWAARLAPGESSIILNNLIYMRDEDEDESSGDENDAEKEEDDMDVDMDAGSTSPKNGRRKGKGRGRGRPTKVAAKASTSGKNSKSPKKKAINKVGEIQLKLNKFVVKVDKPGEWNIQLPVGPSTIEVGEVGGMIWKLYTERLADV